MKVVFIIALCFFVCADELLGQEHARVIERHTTYTLHENETADIEDHYKIQILSEKGQHFGTYREYLDKFRKINELTIDVFDSDGKKVKRLRRSDGTEYGFSPSNEITDGKVLIIRSDYKKYPFTIEVTAKLKLDGYISLPTWVPRDEFYLSVKEANLTVIRPHTLVINSRDEHIKAVIQTRGNSVVTTYKVRDLAYTDGKVRYRDFYSDQPKVLISPQNFRLDNKPGSNDSWKDFGNWYLALNSDPFKLTKKTKEFIDGVGKGDRKKLIRNIYEYMQDNTRYVSIQLGIGGFKSLPTEDVENYGYGDCKALTTYMKNMLDYAGVKSNYVLARAGDDVPDVIQDFPGNQFNHVFLGIPSSTDTVFLECTSQISPANFTGSFTDDRNVLWIENDKSSIIRSRTYNHIDNIQQSKITIALDLNGDASADFNFSSQGIFFDEVMIFKLAPADYLKSHHQTKFNYDDFTIKEFTYEHPDKHSSKFSTRYRLQVSGLAKLVNERLVLPVAPIMPFHQYVEKDNLKMFYSIKRGFTQFDEIEINLPENYWIYSLPEPEEINSRFGNYNIAVDINDNKLTIRRKIVLYKGDYTKTEYENFKVFYQQVEKLEKRKLVLSPKT